MPHGNYKGRDVVCPFYKGEEDNSIACEGMGPGMKTVMCFATKERKAVFAARKCKDMKGYKSCVYACAMMKKYEEG